eukprot:987571-Rhodomonas_salina.1
MAPSATQPATPTQGHAVQATADTLPPATEDKTTAIKQSQIDATAQYEESKLLQRKKIASVLLGMFDLSPPRGVLGVHFTYFNEIQYTVAGILRISTLSRPSCLRYNATSSTKLVKSINAKFRSGTAPDGCVTAGVASRQDILNDSFSRSSVSLCRSLTRMLLSTPAHTHHLFSSLGTGSAFFRVELVWKTT